MSTSKLDVLPYYPSNFLHGPNIISEFFTWSGFIHQKFYSKENSKEVISRRIFNVKSPRKFVRFKSNLRPNFSHFRNHWDFPCRPRNQKRWRRTKIDFMRQGFEIES